jgi:hypothetical protein
MEIFKFSDARQQSESSPKVLEYGPNRPEDLLKGDESRRAARRC